MDPNWERFAQVLRVGRPTKVEATSASINVGATGNVDLTIPFGKNTAALAPGGSTTREDEVYILGWRVSAVGAVTDFDFEIFEKSTRTRDDLSVQDVDNNLVTVEQLPQPWYYKDEDASGKMHAKLSNVAGVASAFKVTVWVVRTPNVG